MRLYEISSQFTKKGLNRDGVYDYLRFGIIHESTPALIELHISENKPFRIVLYDEIGSPMFEELVSHAQKNNICLVRGEKHPMRHLGKIIVNTK